MKLTSRFKKKKKAPIEDTMGFSSKMTDSKARLINKDGTFNILREGISAYTPYQNLVEMSWRRFFVLILIFYITINAIFGMLYLIIGVECLTEVESKSLLEDFITSFFFSVQTFTTVGYGVISPEGIPANIIAATGALVGLMSFALATGLFFARFSKPSARILFSQHAIIAPYGNGQSLQFRIANQRDNKIFNMEARVTMTWVQEEEGKMRRKFAGLTLERDKIFLFPLNWTLVHILEQDSPMYGKTAEELKAMNAEFIVLIKGHDETFDQMIYVNGSYTWNEIKWGYEFSRMYRSNNKGQTVFNLDAIDDMKAI